MLNIRPASKADVQRITDIYNDAVLHTTATFDLEIQSYEDRMNWFNNHGRRHPVLVAEQEGKVTGWAALSKWSERCGYDNTAEVAFYIDPNYRNQGTGKKLLEVLTLEADKIGMHSLVSRITEGNLNSIHIHELYGFQHIGVVKEAGKKFGKYLDVHLMQKLFPHNP
ncbi:MAG TPA: GNAT family N-acetyltransferase [Bacteroidia bacterium]|nr:GNAT family N-acetyltransferase [Bacteroidia bacterium]